MELEFYLLWLPVVNCRLPSLLIKEAGFFARFFVENSIKKSVGLLEGNIISSHLLHELPPVRKEAFVDFGHIELNLGPAEIPILLTYSLLRRHPFIARLRDDRAQRMSV